MTHLAIHFWEGLSCHVVKVEEETYSSGNLGRYKSILQEEYDKIYLIPKK
jgi:hypothetical protein